MIEVLALVCTLTGACKDVQLSVTAESVTPQQCMLYGQVELAKWIADNPGWTPRKITCQRVGRYAKA